MKEISIKKTVLNQNHWTLLHSYNPDSPVGWSRHCTYIELYPTQTTLST